MKNCDLNFHGRYYYIDLGRVSDVLRASRTNGNFEYGFSAIAALVR